MITTHAAARLGIFASALGLVASAAGQSLRAESPAPVPVIFDTDICEDCDDVAALAMLHALESRGQCRLLAVTVTADHPQSAPFVDCVNTFYGRPDIPIGVVRPGGIKPPTVYLNLAAEKTAAGFRYPHDLLDGKDAPDAVSLLRKTLAAAEDGSVRGQRAPLSEPEHPRGFWHAPRALGRG